MFKIKLKPKNNLFNLVGKRYNIGFLKPGMNIVLCKHGDTNNKYDIDLMYVVSTCKKGYRTFTCEQGNGSWTEDFLLEHLNHGWATILNEENFYERKNI
jgi:hypothetical protein